VIGEGWRNRDSLVFRDAGCLESGMALPNRVRRGKYSAALPLRRTGKSLGSHGRLANQFQVGAAGPSEDKRPGSFGYSFPHRLGC